jgi:neutral amino acid transport system permease protein
MAAGASRGWGVMALLAFVIILLSPGFVAAQGEGGGNGSSESIIGGLSDTHGEPVVGVEIVVRLGDDVVGQGTSDDRGQWQVAVPGPGSYEVELDTSTLPEGVELRDADRSVLSDVRVREGHSKRVLFAIGARTGGISDLERFSTLLVDGVRIGLVLALMSVGLSLVFGVTGLVNFAHGELVTFGALIAFLFSTPSGVDLPLILAALIALAFGAAFGLANEAVVFGPLRRRRTGNVSLIVVTIGLSLVLRNVYLLQFGGNPRPYDQYTIQRGLDLPLISPRAKDLIVIVIAASALACYGLLLSNTRIGTATRAVADSRDLAEASGVDVNHVVLTTWATAGALAALGGVLWGVTETISSDMGFTLLLLMFAAVILGGIGTAYGPLLGGLVIGLAAQVSTYWIDPKFRTGVALAALILVILVRPQGIMGRRGRVG